MKKILQLIIPDLLAIIAFVIISCVYFSPVIEGKVLPQSDMIQVRGMIKEINDYHEATGKHSLWTNSMFGGMPTYQIKGLDVFNLFAKLQWVGRLFLPYFTIGVLFVYLAGFYFLLRILHIRHLLSFAGAIAFAFISYNLIIIYAGHISKAYAIGYIAPAIAGIILLYRGKFISGGIISLVSIGIQISCNHYQITYYMFLTIGLFILFKAIESFKQKQLRNFFIASFIFACSVIISLFPNIAIFWMTYEYGKFTTRSPSELTDNKTDKTTGLDKSYILNDYSYGIAETMNLLIPNFMGGPSASPLPSGGEVSSLLKRSGYPEHEIQNIISRMPTYHGPQRFTVGPVYIGAVSIFLFVMALFLLKGTIKYWLVTAFTFSIMLAWGKHFLLLSEFFINYVPAYDKFRTVSMILVITSFVIPFGAILGLKKILNPEYPLRNAFKSLKYGYFITGGICLFFGLIGYNMLNYSSSGDINMPAQILDALKADRASLLRADAFRSLGLITAGAVLIYSVLKKKLSEKYFLIAISVLFFIDLWPVGKRYLNNSHFVSKKADREIISPSAADLQILQDTTYYRVLNLSLDPFNDASTSYFHKSIGGYHGAKLRRYQEIIEKHISRSNLAVINMLNTKYIIQPSDDRKSRTVINNPDALGNAWFVDSLLWVNSADEEIEGLNHINPMITAIINKKSGNNINESIIFPPDSADHITLLSYAPDELIYMASTGGNRFAVFSEIYYPKGWKAFINDIPAEHVQVNYILRGMVIPEGNHVIRFIFQPDSFFITKKIAGISSVLILLLIFGGVYQEIKSRYKTVDNDLNAD